MKRKTAMALAAVFAMSVAGTALAAPVNPFSDVPAKHWAYDSVSKLAQAGVISGYGDGTYKGEKTMTRYEMAAIIGKALANSDKADAELQDELEALQAEFSVELYNLGVRVDNLESKVSNVKFTGEIRSRYDYQENVKGDSSDNSNRTRLRLYMKAPVADNVTFHGRYEAQSVWGTGSASSLNQAYITGDLGGLKYSFGRQPVVLGQKLISDVSGNNDGLFLSAGKEVKVTVGVFKKDQKAYDYKGLVLEKDETDKDKIEAVATDNAKLHGNLNYYAANIDAKLDKNLGLSLSYLQDKDSDFYKTYSAGLKFTGIRNFTISGEYGENDSDYAKDMQGDDQAKAWMAKVQYKGAQKSKVGTYGIWAGYRDAEQGFDPAQMTTLDQGKLDGGKFATDWGKADNIKGAEFGFNYTVFKNGIFTAQYGDLELKDANVGADKDKKNFFAHLRYWF
ncbi:MAG: S-layer homology domain-containing protein [Sporomusa sp.]